MGSRLWPVWRLSGLSATAWLTASLIWRSLPMFILTVSRHTSYRSCLRRLWRRQLADVVLSTPRPLFKACKINGCQYTRSFPLSSDVLAIVWRLGILRQWARMEAGMPVRAEVISRCSFALDDRAYPILVVHCWRAERGSLRPVLGFPCMIIIPNSSPVPSLGRTRNVCSNSLYLDTHVAQMSDSSRRTALLIYLFNFNTVWRRSTIYCIKV